MPIEMTIELAWSLIKIVGYLGAWLFYRQMANNNA